MKISLVENKMDGVIGMEKVKVTQEQAKAIEINREVDSNGEILNDYFEEWPVGHWSRAVIKRMDIDVLVKALYIGYEVEEEFKKFDWVTFDGKHTGIIIDIDEFDNMYKTDIRNENGVKQMFPFGTDRLRHATPSEIAEEKERRKWKKHGRDVWELTRRDVLFNKNTDHIYEIMEISPSGNGISFHGDVTYREMEVVKENYKVICFAENRLDGDSDENHRLD